MLSTGNKMAFVIGFGAGYVLGTRAGRERYRQIVGVAGRVWHDPHVQHAADEVQSAAKEAGSTAATAAGVAAYAAADKASETAGKVADSAREKLHSVTHSEETSSDSTGS